MSGVAGVEATGTASEKVGARNSVLAAAHSLVEAFGRHDTHTYFDG